MCPPSRTFCGSEYPPRASLSTPLIWITSSSGTGVTCRWRLAASWKLRLQLFVTLDSQRRRRDQASVSLSGHSKYFCFLTPSGSRLRSVLSLRNAARDQVSFLLSSGGRVLYLLLRFTLFCLLLFAAVLLFFFSSLSHLDGIAESSNLPTLQDVLRV